jgi:hypothetical protein
MNKHLKEAVYIYYTYTGDTKIITLPLLKKYSSSNMKEPLGNYTNNHIFNIFYKIFYKTQNNNTTMMLSYIQLNFRVSLVPR